MSAQGRQRQNIRALDRPSPAPSKPHCEVGEKTAVIENGLEIGDESSSDQPDEAPYTTAISAPDAQTAAKAHCNRGNGGGRPSTPTSTTEIT